MERLAALEAEVKADADAQRTRRAAAAAKLRDQRVTQTARDADVRKRTTSIDEPAPRRRARKDEAAAGGSLDGLSGAIELASKANQVKQELQRPTRKGDKSWIASGVASMALGPIGWLYAGSLREAVPAAAAWVVIATAVWTVLPFLMTPLFLVAMPVSAIAGVVYALQYNRSGRRQRLFGGKKKATAELDSPSASARRKLLKGE